MVRSQFIPKKSILERVLIAGKILADRETPAQMFERVVEAIFRQDFNFTRDKHSSREYADRLLLNLDSKKIIFSTPVLTNAGRKDFSRPLSACVVPDISDKTSYEDLRRIINTYHQEAMGTGFTLNGFNKIVEQILNLNNIAVDGSISGMEDRPVGNMAICGVDHPEIIDFITLKMLRPDVRWKFNLSVDTSDHFWQMVDADSIFSLKNNYTVRAGELLDLMSYSAHKCADPGIIFMDRVNRDNPVPGMGNYTSVAPCGEAGLLPGETCQFGYINVSMFLNEKGEIDIDGVRSITRDMLRALDNCVEINLGTYSMPISRYVVSRRRKIGIGICGLADLFIKMSISYDSDIARDLARDLVALINFESKKYSHELAKSRGSFIAMSDLIGCSYNHNDGYIERKYGESNTRWVKDSDWNNLAQKIRETGMLRNSTTIAIPPTGRSALVISASTGIEPIFSLFDERGDLCEVVEEFLNKHLPDFSSLEKTEEQVEKIILENQNFLAILATSKNVSMMGHLKMVASVQEVVDEAISKTINMPHDSTVDQVKSSFKFAYINKLKGVTIYRDGSKESQPKKL